MQSMRNRTLTVAADGSFNRAKSEELCGAGCILYCKWAGQSICGNIAERPSTTSSYRGESIGMLATHLRLLTIREH